MRVSACFLSARGTEPRDGPARGNETQGIHRIEGSGQLGQAGFVDLPAQRETGDETLELLGHGLA